MIESVSELFTGRGSADALARVLGNSRRLIKGVCVKALSTNTLSVFVGPSTVSVTTGFELGAGDKVVIEIDDPSKLSVIASPTQNQQQTIAISGSGTGDTFKLTFKGETTAAIAQNADAAAVESALEALSNVAAADVAVTGGPGPGTDWVVEWTGQYEKVNQPLMTVSEAGRNEKQTVGIDNATTGGHFHLTYDSQTTGEIAWNASAADVKSALEVLSSIGSGNVDVTGGPGPSTDWVVEFKGSLARTDVGLLYGDGTALIGGSTTVTITETVAGNACTVIVTQSQDAGAASQYCWIGQ